MNTDFVCPRCGRVLASAAMKCPDCSQQSRSWFRKQSVVVPVLALTAAVSCVVTLTVTRAFESKKQRLATQWFERGERDMRGGKPLAAVDEYDTAMTYSQDNSEYRMRLAEALAAAGRTNEALSYFLILWDSDPASGPLNLEIARLEVRKKNFPEAIRYFHSAIDGIWEETPQQHRLQTRLELVNFLLQNQERTQAQSELIAALPELPRDAGVQAQIAKLLLETGSYPRALELARQALQMDSSNLQAGAVAGQAAFQLQQYRTALPYLKAAASQDTPSAQLLRTTELILDHDPFAPGLGAAERARRALIDVKEAEARLQQCAESKNITLGANAPTDSLLEPPYEEWKKLEPEATERRLRRDADLREAVMKSVFAMEDASEKTCGAPDELDSALELMARANESTEK